MLLFYWCLVGSAAASVTDLELDARASREHRVNSIKLLMYTCLLCLTILTVWLFKNRGCGGYLHESGLAVVYGLLIGATIRYSGYASSASNVHVINDKYNVSMPPQKVVLKLYNKNVEEVLDNRDKSFVYEFRGELNEMYEDDLKATFDPEIFFDIILPLIIFNAGYSLERTHFFHNLGAILSYAVVGTAISSFAIGGLIYGCVQLMPDYLALDLTFLDTLFFGALISPTDPVTVLAIFAETRVDPTLFALVAGESLMNDAVALVLSGTIQDYEDFHIASNGFLTFLKAAGYFIGTFTLSFLVGVFIGCLTSLLMKFTKIRSWPILETSLVILMSYTAYLIAEVCQLTGVVSILFCGICQSHYTYKNLSEEARARTRQASGLFNFFAENFTFAYVGVSMFSFARHRFDKWFILAGFISAFMGRIVSVYPLSWLMNSIRTDQIPWNYQHMLAFAGLRGAMSFALAIRNTVSEARQCILTTTSLIVIFSVIVQGGATGYMLKLLQIPVDLLDQTDTDVTTTDSSARVKWNVHASSVNLPTHITNNVKFSSRVKSILEKRTWASFDARYLMPLLTSSPQPCDEVLTSTLQPEERLVASDQDLAVDDCREGETAQLVE